MNIALNRKALAVAGLLGLVILLFNVATLEYVLTQFPNEVSSNGVFTLDGKHYTFNAYRMIRDGEWFYTRDIYHSPGGQVWVSWVYRLFGQGPLSVKLVNVALFVAIQWLLFKWARRFLDICWSLIAVLLVATSLPMLTFVGTVQYEILLGFIVTGLLYRLTLPSEGRSFEIGATVGLLCFLAFMLRYHFVALLVPVIWSLRRDRKALLAFAGVYGICVLFFIADYAFHGVTLRMVQDASAQQSRWLTPTSLGFNFPFPPTDPTKPVGWAYVTDYPGHYLWQLGQRVCYLFGFKTDYFSLEAPFTAVLKFLLLVTGLYWLKRDQRQVFVGYVLVASVFVAPLLVIGTTTRFLLPLWPVHSLIIAYTLKNLADRWDLTRAKRAPLQSDIVTGP